MTDIATPVDAGAAALALCLQVIGLPIRAEEIVHQSGKPRLDATDLIRFARSQSVKARLISSNPDRLSSAPTPALARLRNGGWVVLGRVTDEQVLIQNPLERTPRLVKIADFTAEWDGALLLLARRASLTDPNQRFGLPWFFAAMRKYRQPLTEVMTASFFVQVFALLIPLIFQVIIDKVFVQRGLSTLDVLAIGMIALSVFDVVLGGIRTWLLAHTSNRIDVELGARLFRHLFALPMSYFQSRRVGDTIARVRELDNIRQFLTSSAITLSLDLFFSMVFLVVLLIYSPELTLIVAATLPLYVLLSLGLTPSFRRRLEEKFRRGSQNQSFLVEAVAGAETIKSMAVEPILQRRWEEQLAAYVQASFGVSTLNTIGSQVAAFINKAMVVLVLFFGAQLVIHQHLTVGELVAFNMISGQLAAPVLRIAQLWQDFQQVRISIDRTGDILNTPPEPGRSGGPQLPAIRGHVKLEGVDFRYRLDGPLVIKNVSLDIPAGQVVGIVGSSGSGKSTIGKLIQRFYVPEAGRISVDGHDLALTDPAWLRRQIGVVLQENVLFNSTVRENIALAFTEGAAPMERIMEAAELAGAHEFILDLPQGYETMIGERGATLSGGQRQRIAIARALMSNPRILIFDEATSALDYESEAAIQANMRRICAGRTVLLIAHRLATLRMASRIVTIERGQIIEDGSHQSLIKAGGRYAALWGLQTADLAPSMQNAV